MPAEPAIAAPRSNLRAQLLRIYAAAVSAVDARRLMARALGGELAGAAEIPAILEQASAVRLLAVGKAAAGMATEAQQLVGGKLRDALAIVAGGASGDLAKNLCVMSGSHPLPDASSEAAGRAAIEFVARARPGDLLLFALSGGASALMAVPAGNVTLADKSAVTAALMRSGASIRELNTLRKHLSQIKGGGLLRALKPGVRVLSLILSDVPGNDPATIGSGPTVADPSTYSDAVATLKRRSLWGRCPETIRDHLERGFAGELEETLKSGNPVLSAVNNIIVGDNQTALEASAQAASSLGYEIEFWHGLAGEADDVGRALARHLSTVGRPRLCIIAGGEPVVTVRGGGQGGRAQQLALAMAAETERLHADSASDAHHFTIDALVAGTDGVDGPTDAAGAIIGPATCLRAAEAGLNPRRSLDRNDAYNFFKALGDLVMTGPTGTNAGDIFIGLVND
jgi:glycerate 2-kinase